MDEITYSDYWTTVAEVADYLAEIVQTSEQIKEDFCLFYDTLHETVDAHQWVIYTFYNAQIMRHTDSPDAVFDIGVGVPEGAESWTDIVLGFAFYAFYQDIEQNYFRRYDESGIEKIELIDPLPEDFEPDPDLVREDKELEIYNNLNPDQLLEIYNDMMEKAGN